MSAYETTIAAELAACGVPADAVRLTRPRRLFAAVERSLFDTIYHHAREKLGFIFLAAITGLDEGETFGIVYHLARQDGIMLNLKIAVPRAEATIATVTRDYPGAEIFERELVDLFGIRVEGLPPGKRYPLPDDWPDGEYPLRKDWKPSTGKSNAEASHA